jgi:hypothetical protein
LIGIGGHSRLQDLIPETTPPEPRRKLLSYLPARFVVKHRRPLASFPPVKILKISQPLNLREIENRRRQNTPLITTAPRKVKRFNIRYRRRQRRKTQNSSSAQPATATIETDSIEEVIIFSTRLLHAMALRNRKKVLLEWRVHLYWRATYCYRIGSGPSVLQVSRHIFPAID